MTQGMNLQGIRRKIVYVSLYELFAIAISSTGLALGSGSSLERAGVLARKNATCYPGFESQLGSAHVKNQPVVVDGNVTTSRGPGTAMKFALALVEQLEGRSKADKLRDQMLV